MSSLFGLLSSVGEAFLSLLPRTELAVFGGPLNTSPDAVGGKDPSTGCINLCLQAAPQRPWVHLYGRLGRMAKERFVDVYLESATEEAVFRIPLNRNGTLSEILPLTPSTKAIRLEVSAEASSVLFQELRVVEISDWERTLRLLDRVWRFAPGALLEIPLLDRLSKLDDLYSAVRARRLARLGWNSYELFLNAVEAPQIERSRQLAGVAVSSGIIPDPAVFEVHLSGGTPEARRCTLESLHSQTYPHWRLAGDEPADASRAEWILALRAGDVLRADALQHFVQTAEEAPGASVIYSDHDFIGEDGKRHAPAFKPDWNPDLFYTHNYLADPCVFRAAACLRHNVNGNALLDEPARYELILRIADSGPHAIRHISQVLCHRNASPKALPTLGFGAQHGILQRHLAQSGAVVEGGCLPGTSRVLWPLPEASPLVSLIVATRDQRRLLEACVRSIQTKTRYSNWELIVLDNQSADPTTHSYFDQLREEPRIRVVPYPKPFNYAALQNFGVRHSRGEVLVFLNNDVEVLSPNWLDDLVMHALRPDVGAVGARLLYSDGSIQHAGVVLGIGGVAGHVHRFCPGESPGYCGRIQLTHELSAVTAACLAVRKTAFEAVGGFDERHLKVALNDVDLCLKLTVHGLRNIYEPAVLLYHHESVSRGPDDTPRKRRIFLRERRKMLARWKGKLKRDPHYNDNLTRHSEDYGLRVENV
jgi:GT2 family glycosyltransferase